MDEWEIDAEIFGMELEWATPEERYKMISRKLHELASRRKDLMSAIDPTDCGCTDCITHESIPLEQMSRDDWGLWTRGYMHNRTGLTDAQLDALAKTEMDRLS